MLPTKTRALRVCGVNMHTRRDEAEIIYDVTVVVDDPSAFEQGEDERGVWEWRVPFGQTDATVAGGARFVEAARCQQRIADEVWAAFHGVNADSKWFPNSAAPWKDVQP
jgi:hypothetical protein